MVQILSQAILFPTTYLRTIPKLTGVWYESFWKISTSMKFFLINLIFRKNWMTMITTGDDLRQTNKTVYIGKSVSSTTRELYRIPSCWQSRVTSNISTPSLKICWLSKHWKIKELVNRYYMKVVSTFNWIVALCKSVYDLINIFQKNWLVAEECSIGHSVDRTWCHWIFIFGSICPNRIRWN